jgi:hypothetical protein
MEGEPLTFADAPFETEISVSFSVGFEVLTVVVMKRSGCKGITPCSLLRINFSEELVALIFRVSVKALLAT